MLLLAWIFLAPPGALAPHAVPAVAAAEGLAPEAIRHLQGALGTYEQIRKSLGSSQLMHMDALASQMDTHLGNAVEALPAGNPARVRAEAARTAARAMVGARQLADARSAFRTASEALVALARIEPRLRTGRTLFVCPSGEGAGTWIQTTREPDNPYLGDGTPGCGEPVPWDQATEGATPR